MVKTALNVLNKYVHGYVFKEFVVDSFFNELILSRFCGNDITIKTFPSTGINEIIANDQVLYNSKMIWSSDNLLDIKYRVGEVIKNNFPSGILLQKIEIYEGLLDEASAVIIDLLFDRDCIYRTYFSKDYYIENDGKSSFRIMEFSKQNRRNYSYCIECSFNNKIKQLSCDLNKQITFSII